MKIQKVEMAPCIKFSERYSDRKNVRKIFYNYTMYTLKIVTCFLGEATRRPGTNLIKFKHAYSSSSSNWTTASCRTLSGVFLKKKKIHKTSLAIIYVYILSFWQTKIAFNFLKTKLIFDHFSSLKHINMMPVRQESRVHVAYIKII